MTAEHTTTIAIDGAEYEISGKEVSYEQLLDLAFEGSPPTGENVLITVAYMRAHGNKSGTLTPGQTVKVKEGMIFDVEATDKS